MKVTVYLTPFCVCVCVWNIIATNSMLSLHPEDGGSIDIWNVGISPHHYTESQPSRPRLKMCSLEEKMYTNCPWKWVSFMYRILLYSRKLRIYRTSKLLHICLNTLYIKSDTQITDWKIPVTVNVSPRHEIRYRLTHLPLPPGRVQWDGSPQLRG